MMGQTTVQTSRITLLENFENIYNRCPNRKLQMLHKRLPLLNKQHFVTSLSNAIYHDIRFDK